VEAYLLAVSIKQFLIKLSRWLFARKKFFKLNRLLFLFSLRGLGILNYENEQVSGEEYFLKSLLRDESGLVIFDVGANVGRYATKIKSLSPKTDVYAFEPGPQAFKHLECAALDYGYYALNVACGDKLGEMELYDYLGSDSGSEHASLYREVLDKIHHHEAQAVTVKVITLDQFIESAGLTNIHLLKVDTEGHELKVLMGAQKAIESATIDIIQFEFNSMGVISRVFMADFYDLLKGYTFYRMLPDGLAPLGEYTPIHCEIFDFQNIVAIRNGSRLARKLTDD
jgi:FkbM family methyltransferase